MFDRWARIANFFLMVFFQIVLAGLLDLTGGREVIIIFRRFVDRLFYSFCLDF